VLKTSRDADCHANVTQGVAMSSVVVMQFVPFREFIGAEYDLTRSQAVLAKEVLAEIPDQFVSYMKSKGVRPRPPPPPYEA